MGTGTVVDVSALELGLGEIVLRLVCAMLVGAVIGAERELIHRPAGIRTHMLVALGASAVMITSQMIFAQYRPYGATPDPARLSAQVITGIGFLGAGTILKGGPTIRGLTTAASVWAIACLGVAVGAGYYAVGLIGALCMLVTLVIFEKIQRLLLRNHYGNRSYNVTCKDVGRALKLIYRLAGEANASLLSTEVDGDEERFHISFKLNFNGRKPAEREQKFFAALSGDECVCSASVEQAGL